MMDNEDQTRSDRWLDAGSYRKNWAARSAAMLGLYDEITPAATQAEGVRIAEFGCGANSPVWTLCKDRAGATVQRYDLRAWNADVIAVDLNADFRLDADYDLVTLSGVCEYLNDINAVCATLMRHSKAAAISYAFMPIEARATDQDYLKSLRRRIVRNGWRSHLFLEEFMALLSNHGVVANVGFWNGQALFILRRFETVNL